jgi:hypothetical protein
VRRCNKGVRGCRCSTKIANGATHGKAHRWAPSAAEETHRPGGRLAPHGCVLLTRRKEVREVLLAVANQTRARLTGGNFGCEAAARAEQREKESGEATASRVMEWNRTTGELERVGSSFK